MCFEDTCGCCYSLCKALLLILLWPFTLIVCLVGVIVFIILLPFYICSKCCCCPGCCLVNCVEDHIVKKMIKLPLLVCLTICASCGSAADRTHDIVK